MARSKARQVRAPPEKVKLEGVDENGNQTTVTWKIYALEGKELLELDEYDEEEDSIEIFEHMLYHTLKKHDPNIQRENVLDFDWPFLEQFLEAIGQVNGMEDFLDKEEIKKELKNRQ